MRICLGGAGIACEGNDVHQGIIKELLVDIGLGDGGADGHLVGGGLEGHAQSQTHALADDGALQEHVAALLESITADHFIGDHVNALEVTALISELCNFFKYILTDLINNAVKTSHYTPP